MTAHDRVPALFCRGSGQSWDCLWTATNPVATSSASGPSSTFSFPPHLFSPASPFSIPRTRNHTRTPTTPTTHLPSACRQKKERGKKKKRRTGQRLLFCLPSFNEFLWHHLFFSPFLLCPPPLSLVSQLRCASLCDTANQPVCLGPNSGPFHISTPGSPNTHTCAQHKSQPLLPPTTTHTVRSAATHGQRLPITLILLIVNNKSVIIVIAFILIGTIHTT